MPELMVAGRRIILDSGEKSQTVNVCGTGGIHGVYDWIVRWDATISVQAEIERTGTALQSIEDFVRWLKNELGGNVERVPPAQDVLLTNTRPPSQDPDPEFFRLVASLIETSIDELAIAFLASPYHHRREHNLHAELFRLMSRDERLCATCPLSNGERIRLLQQEWPERPYQERLGSFDLDVLWPVTQQTIGPKSSKRRGLYDVAILSPLVMSAATTVSFLEGAVPPSVAIEFGLIENYDHLRADAAKLVNNLVPHGYLIHFARPEQTDNFEAVESLLEMLGRNTSVRSAYARVEKQKGKTKYHYKLIGSDRVIHSDRLP